MLDARPPGTAIVVLQYREPFGLVDIWEETPQITSRQFRHLITQWVALNGNPGSSGTSTSARVRGRYPALITTTADGRRSGIEWIQAGVEYVIGGPTLTKTATAWPASSPRNPNPPPANMRADQLGLAGPEPTADTARQHAARTG